MAEAVAAISLLSSIIQLVDFASKVSSRLQEFRTDVVQAPKAFESIRNRVPLMLDLVERIRTQVENGALTSSSQETIIPVIQACFTQLQELDEVLDKVISLPNHSALARGRKALSSVLHEPEIERIDAGLRTNFDLLVQAATLHAVSDTDRRASSISSSHSIINLILSQTSSQPVELQRRQSEAIRYNAPKPISPIFMMPYPRDRKFLGRQDIIDDIEFKFQSQRQVALAGLGGVGKSQIAIEYCYVFHDKLPKAHKFWIYAGSRSRFEQGYQEIARRLELPGWDDQRVDSMQLVFSWLSDEHNGTWLMIVDNADDASMFFGDRSISRSQSTEQIKSLAYYLPQSPKGSILVTTRDKRAGERLAGRERPVEVLPMSTDDAKVLLLSKIPPNNDEASNDSDATRLVEELAHLPLAITQAAAFISENMLSVSEYLELLATGDLELQDLLSEHLEDPRRDLDTENSVIRTWKLSFDQLLKGKPRAAEILSLMAVLDYHATPRMLLRGDGETEIGFRTALGALQAFSLITPGKSADAAYKMHRLVAISTQKWLDMQGTLSYWQQQALTKLAETYPDRQSFENWALLEVLTPHAQLVFSFTFSTAVELLQCAKLLDFSALYDLGKGRYNEAHEKALKSIEIRQRLLPAENQLTLDSLQILGETQLHLGELRTAKDTLQRAITGREKQLGELHPDTLESVSDLTITLLELDEVSAAEQTSLRALEGRKKVLGEDHPDTLVSLNILAMVRQRQGDLDAASEAGQKVLSARIAVLGEGHPDTIMTMNNLAVLRYRQGNLEAAKTLLQKVLTGEEKLIGSDCFDLQVSLSTMAFVVGDQGFLDSAEAMHREVLAMRERLYGPQHPATLYSIKNVAYTLEKKGLVDEAELMMQNARSHLENEPPSPSQSPGALLTSGLLFD